MNSIKVVNTWHISKRHEEGKKRGRQGDQQIGKERGREGERKGRTVRSL